MLGIPSPTKICGHCRHFLRWHSREKYDARQPCLLCECTDLAHGIDNLAYIDFVTAMRPRWGKRLGIVLLDLIVTPLASFAAYVHRKNEGVFEWLLMRIILPGMMLGVVIGGGFAISGAVRSDRERTRMVANSWVECYTGERLLYEGFVEKMEQHQFNVEIKTANGDEYICTGFKRSDKPRVVKG